MLQKLKQTWFSNVLGDALAGLVPELTNVAWHVYAMTAAGLGIIYLFPYVPEIGKLIPSQLVCILTLTTVAIYLGLDIRTVGDMGQLPDTLPIFCGLKCR